MDLLAPVFLIGAFSSVQLARWVCTHRRDVWTKGKILTAPLARRCRISPLHVRTLQAQVGAIGYFACLVDALCVRDYGPPLIAGCIGEIVLVALPAIDDLLTGDDDRWQRFKDAVRNKVKWRMKLPQPVRRPAPAGA